MELKHPWQFPIGRQWYPTAGRLQDCFFRSPSSFHLPSLLHQRRERKREKGHVGVLDIVLSLRFCSKLQTSDVMMATRCFRLSRNPVPLCPSAIRSSYPQNLTYARPSRLGITPPFVGVAGQVVYPHARACATFGGMIKRGLGTLKIETKTSRQGILRDLYTFRSPPTNS